MKALPRFSSIALALRLGALALVPACSSEMAAADSGAEPVDGGEVVYDGGTLGLCPQEPNPACTRASDCGDDQTKQSNCGSCTPYNRSLCATARCETPAQLGAGDIHNVVFQVGSLQLELKSFTGVALAATTAGGNTITCEDVYAGRVDPADPCYNVLDSRGLAAIAQSGDTYVFTFSRFASGLRTLFLIYGHAMENSEGNPIGVSCTERDVAQPGGGREDLPGDMMRRIQ